ncbi:MAG: urate oxidase [Micromonosporaceae bacterium]|nr:urate oxidase [Micromonosporaceae bacterium]
MLGHHNYGEAEVRLLRVTRGPDRHDIVDLTVSVMLAGAFDVSYLTGDNTNILPADTQKNTVYAFARDGIGSPETFGLRLAQHFVDSQPSIYRARVSLVEYPWTRVGGHTFVRAGGGHRTAAVTYDGSHAWVVAGIVDLALLNSTHAEYTGFIVDRYTTLAPTSDRILAVTVNAQWRYSITTAEPARWHRMHDQARRALTDAFAGTYSRSPQQTLHTLGQALLDAVPEAAEVRLSLSSRHPAVVDLAPFGRDNPGEVYDPTDRPYELVEGAVLREGAPPAGLAWSLLSGV